MRYISTRDKFCKVNASNAIAQGLSHDGGLFVPEVIPSFSPRAIEELCGMSYIQRAVYVMGMYLDEFSAGELNAFCQKAYSAEKFDHPEIAPIHSIDENTHFLELWHGPTSAFKDMALQMLPYLLTASLKKCSEEKHVCILVATSGDTGKAALEGFCDVPGTSILVFYPKDGVSSIQELQMTSQAGNNVGVCAVRGNFDDAQSGVKTIFSDVGLREELERGKKMLSSANSINWGRVLPQIVYYISAYCDLVCEGKIKQGDKIHICVPTGNFGNILAAYYAKQMGLPIDKLICASNQNNVLTDFIQTGTYDKNREFFTTISPSMDILISSNLERLLFMLSGSSDEEVRGYMAQLSEKGAYTVSESMKNMIQNNFVAGFCTEENARKVITETWKHFNYLIDPHTAVGFEVLLRYRASTKDNTPVVIASTASPFKFCDSVLECFGQRSRGGVELIEKLENCTGVTAPRPLAELRNKTPRFDNVINKTEMKQFVVEFLK